MLRMGVAEMTRFGMGPQGFQQLAQLIRDVVIDDIEVKEEASKLRQQYVDLQFCFRGDAFEEQMKALMALLV
jgi:aminomethyltransferase